MKQRLILNSCIAGLLLALVAPALGADEGKEVTLTGEGKCAKCILKTSDKCQNVLQTKEDGKTVNYYMTKNDVAKEFHDNICTGPSKKWTAKRKSPPRRLNW